MHWWPRLAAAHRRRLSIATSLAGLGFLVAALQSEGQRDTALRSLVLVGPATATAHASATASLYYYVLTGFCLLLGFTGLIASDPLARWLRPRRPAEHGCRRVAGDARAGAAREERCAVGAGGRRRRHVARTVRGGLPGSRRASRARGGAAALWPELLRYAYLVRLVVAAVGVTATRLGAGTHYDVSPLTEVAVAFSDRTWVFEAGSWTQLFWLTLLAAAPDLARFHRARRDGGSGARVRARAGRRRDCARGSGPTAASARVETERRPERRLGRSAHPAVGLARARAAAAAAVREARAGEPRRAVLVAEQVSHSSPVLPQEPIGRASTSSNPNAQ